MQEIAFPLRSNVAVRTSAVSKKYGNVTALDRVDLEVAAGSVYGLVGPNGAGKTTMLGILAGLRHPTGGEVSISPTSVGVLPDTPRFDRWLTGREVVELSRSLADNGTPGSAVGEILETAGLAEAADRKVRGYSRGMLQRLGLAAAVVTEPDLLLLDEPAAALDPAGRREVLDLIGELRGRSTVLFSSHILDDVQEVCDDIGILTRGELVYQGSLDALLLRHVGNQFAVRLRSGEEDVVQRLSGHPWVKKVVVDPSGVVVLDIADVDRAEVELVQVLADAGHPVVSISPLATSLEQVFLEVTK